MGLQIRQTSGIQRNLPGASASTTTAAGGGGGGKELLLRGSPPPPAPTAPKHSSVQPETPQAPLTSGITFVVHQFIELTSPFLVAYDCL